MVEVKSGDRITIKVGGVDYETVIDERGVQRFVENPEHFLVKQIPMVYDSCMKCDIHDMNTMAIRYRKGEFNQRDYAEMNMAIGYSACGFMDLSSFEDMEIVNPLWN